MASLSFAVTYNYRCPYARNLHEHVVTALRAGADWSVEFLPFSLKQTLIGEGEADVWDDPAKDPGLLALQMSVAVRDDQPDRFLDAHMALFALQHDKGGNMRDPDELGGALAGAGVDTKAVFAAVESGKPLDVVRDAHERAALGLGVLGVPTVIAGDEAVFVRLMSRTTGDPAASTVVIDRLVGTVLDWTDLNEFKRTANAQQ